MKGAEKGRSEACLPLVSAPGVSFVPRWNIRSKPGLGRRRENFFCFLGRELQLKWLFCIHRLQNQLCSAHSLRHLTAEDDLLPPAVQGGAVPAALVPW